MLYVDVLTINFKEEILLMHMSGVNKCIFLLHYLSFSKSYFNYSCIYQQNSVISGQGGISRAKGNYPPNQLAAVVLPGEQRHLNAYSLRPYGMRTSVNYIYTYTSRLLQASCCHTCVKYFACMTKLLFRQYQAKSNICMQSDNISLPGVC